MVTLKPILIADDNPNDVLAVKRLFERSKILNPLQSVCDGIETIAYLEGTGTFSDRAAYPYPILLLLDLDMTGKSGWEVLEWLKNQSIHPIAVAVLSGLNVHDVKQAYMLGTRSYLFKPLSFPEFSNLIRHLGGIDMKSCQDGYYLENTGH